MVSLMKGVKRHRVRVCRLTRREFRRHQGRRNLHDRDVCGPQLMTDALGSKSEWRPCSRCRRRLTRAVRMPDRTIRTIAASDFDRRWGRSSAVRRIGAKKFVTMTLSTISMS